ncbi:ATP-binding domain-containing protein [Aeromonas hydrophila]|uniref:ATP-binding domain-containing protein n=1 Tax=Aeromonas hydrophila TaxID=644 RepID=UPI00372CEA78
MTTEWLNWTQARSVYVTQSLLDCMRLGYCITPIKAQGSQFPRIIIALQKGRIADRAWLYTAITRPSMRSISGQHS